MTKITSRTNMDLIKVENCKNIDDIRHQIDRLDNAIMELFAERKKYVDRIVDFKQSKDDVVAEQRQAKVLHKIRTRASQLQLNVEVYENIYQTLINHNIHEELKILEAHSNKK